MEVRKIYDIEQVKERLSEVATERETGDFDTYRNQNETASIEDELYYTGTGGKLYEAIQELGEEGIIEEPKKIANSPDHTESTEEISNLPYGVTD